eukprot:357691-Chlamydomonas_euryale.AAC.2
MANAGQAVHSKRAAHAAQALLSGMAVHAERAPHATPMAGVRALCLDETLVAIPSSSPMTESIPPVASH